MAIKNRSLVISLWRLIEVKNNSSVNNDNTEMNLAENKYIHEDDSSFPTYATPIEGFSNTGHVGNVDEPLTSSKEMICLDAYVPPLLFSNPDALAAEEYISDAERNNNTTCSSASTISPPGKRVRNGTTNDGGVLLLVQAPDDAQDRHQLQPGMHGDIHANIFAGMQANMHVRGVTGAHTSVYTNEESGVIHPSIFTGSPSHFQENKEEGTQDCMDTEGDFSEAVTVEWATNYSRYTHL